MKDFKQQKEVRVEHCDGWGVIVRNFSKNDPESDLENIIDISTYHELADGSIEESDGQLLWGNGPEELISAIQSLIN